MLFTTQSVFCSYECRLQSAGSLFLLPDTNQICTHVCVYQNRQSLKLKISQLQSQGEEEENFLAESVKDLKNRRNKNRHGHKRKGGFNNHHGGKRGRR